jgi:TrmH family RNA methyltransferase
VITSHDNHKLKLVRRLARKREREESGLFAAEGEDLVAAAEAAGWVPEFVLRADVDVEPELLARASGLGSGSRVIGVYRERYSGPGGALAVYLHGVGDPGNVGTVIRAAHGLADGPVVLGPGCADPFGPKAVRASMGSIFARPPARATLSELTATTLALDSGAAASLPEAAAHASAPVVLCVGGERRGLPPELLRAADLTAAIRLREDGPDSLNAAIAAAVGLYELANRMAVDA